MEWLTFETGSILASIKDSITLSVQGVCLQTSLFSYMVIQNNHKLTKISI